MMLSFKMSKVTPEADVSPGEWWAALVHLGNCFATVLIKHGSKTLAADLSRAVGNDN